MSNQKSNWKIIHDSDDDAGNPTLWSTEINHSKYGKYCWINDTGDYFAVEVDYYGDFSELARCKTLISAKRWVATHLLGIKCLEGDDMERLTKKNGYGNYHYPKCLERCGGLNTPEKCYECDFDYAVCKKLGEYEDLEEQGRLIKLPCKVGTDIYYILGIPNETPCVIESCVFELSDIQKIGKTLFLTKSEAEAKLKELRGGEYD